MEKRITFIETYLSILPENISSDKGTLEETLHSFTVKEGFGKGSDWRYDLSYSLNEKENSHWLKKDLRKELKFFLREDIQNFGTWDCHAEDDMFGDSMEYFEVENKLEEICTQITPRLFYSEEHKIGYYILEYANFACPQYNFFFFEK